mmetsp:Transcript_48077/g.134392  ORF Transcript_48077/g.134392 Transcript_48077/m.134392 type:complete len:229 (+) Transcript_48077:1241-1927(+)
MVQHRHRSGASPVRLRKAGCRHNDPINDTSPDADARHLWERLGGLQHLLLQVFCGRVYVERLQHPLFVPGPRHVHATREGARRDGLHLQPDRSEHVARVQQSWRGVGVGRRRLALSRDVVFRRAGRQQRICVPEAHWPRPLVNEWRIGHDEMRVRVQRGDLAYASTHGKMPCRHAPRRGRRRLCELRDRQVQPVHRAGSSRVRAVPLGCHRTRDRERKLYGLLERLVR